MLANLFSAHYLAGKQSIGLCSIEFGCRASFISSIEFDWFKNRTHTKLDNARLMIHIVTNSHHHKTRALSTCFLFFYQINATVIPDYDDETPVSNNTEPSNQNQHLTTINYDTLNRLREESQPTEAQFVTRQGGAAQEVSDELIGTCVTPTRVKNIQHALSKPETARHLCALKLLPHFFRKEELAQSNTDGSHDKKCLDSTKLNSLKILVFSKFPVSNSEEKTKAWRFIKGKINSKCHATQKLLMADFTPPSSS